MRASTRAQRKLDHTRGRARLLVAFFFLIALFIEWRLFDIQVNSHQYFSDLAAKQQAGEVSQILQRGEIYLKDKDGEHYALAVNQKRADVIAIPKIIPSGEQERVAKTLAKILNMDYEETLKRLDKADDPYEPIKNNIDEEVAGQIKKESLPGIRLQPNVYRYYPAENLASHVVGFLGFQGEKRVGQYGVEGYYNKVLQGKNLPASKQQKPLGLVLSIDPNIQFEVERELEKALDKYEAKSGSVIVMNPHTGSVLALANKPDFNPNLYSTIKDYSVFLNPAVANVYEAGSVLKSITMAAALNEGVVEPQTTYIDKGFEFIDGYTIRNANNKVYGQQTMSQVLERSINTGAIYVQRKLGKSKFKEYLLRFGFGEKTGVDLIGEVTGDLSNLDSNRDIEYATAAFGHGISITPIQLISAYAAIANGGELVRPHVLEAYIDNKGSEIPIERTSVRRVISQSAAAKLTAMLVSVVEKGHAQRSKLEHYFIAGKTGTAQVPNPEEAGYLEETIHTFVGYAPAYSPQFVILVKLDSPKALRFAAGTSAVVFREIAKFVLNYYEVVFDR